MKTREMIAQSNINGSRVQVTALQIVCEECDGDNFLIYFIDEIHMHLECTCCHTSFCQNQECYDD